MTGLLNRKAVIAFGWIAFSMTAQGGSPSTSQVDAALLQLKLDPMAEISASLSRLKLNPGAALEAELKTQLGASIEKARLDEWAAHVPSLLKADLDARILDRVQKLADAEIPGVPDIAAHPNFPQWIKSAWSLELPSFNS